MKLGKMIAQVMETIFKKPITVNYPADKSKMPHGFRGKLKFYPEKCIGCKICMKDCPSNAIEIKKVGEKQFEAIVDLDKCIYCAQCVDSCPKAALGITEDFELAQLDRNKLKVSIDVEPQKKSEKDTN